MSTTTELFNKITNRGNSIMTDGDTVTALSNTYSGVPKSEIAGYSNNINNLENANSACIFHVKGLYGLLQCEEALQCHLNGGGTRQVMGVSGTGGGVWTMKGLRFVDAGNGIYIGGGTNRGGGLFMYNSAKVEMTMCEFNNNQATNNVSAFRPATFRHFTKPPLHPQLTPPPLEPSLSSLSSLSREEASTFTALAPTSSTSTRRPSLATYFPLTPLTPLTTLTEAPAKIFTAAAATP